MRLTVSLLLLLAAADRDALVAAAPASAWRNRTIYQLLTDRFAAAQSPPCSDLSTYCGGSWAATTAHLDYIQELGFDAVWISPVVDNAPNGYHGYWATRLHYPNANFGQWSDLQNLSASLHARSMYLMVDVVANHMGNSQGPITNYEPFNDWSQYHDCNSCPAYCTINDYNNPVEMEHCRLAGLYDLNQTDPFVASALLSWITNLTAVTGADGYRIDTIPYVPASFWTAFSAAAGVYTIGEVDMGNVTWVASYQSSGALDATLSYPLFFTLRSVFAGGGSMNQLQALWQAYTAAFRDLSTLGTFIDNHDNPRFLNARNDVVAYTNALLWVLLAEGIPIIYYGSETLFSGGNDPDCREPFWPTGYNPTAGIAPWMAQVIAFRKAAAVWERDHVQRYSDDTFYAFTRGQTFVALTNVGDGGATQTRDITYHPYANGQMLCNLFACSDCVTVTNNAFTVQLDAGAGKVYDPTIHCNAAGEAVYYRS